MGEIKILSGIKPRKVCHIKFLFENTLGESSPLKQKQIQKQATRHGQRRVNNLVKRITV